MPPVPAPAARCPPAPARCGHSSPEGRAESSAEKGGWEEGRGIPRCSGCFSSKHRTQTWESGLVYPLGAVHAWGNAPERTAERIGLIPIRIISEAQAINAVPIPPHPH